MPTPVRSLSRLNRSSDYEARVPGSSDYEALLVRNAPRWLHKLHQFDILVRNDDGTVSVRWPYLKNRTVPVD